MLKPWNGSACLNKHVFRGECFQTISLHLVLILTLTGACFLYCSLMNLNPFPTYLVLYATY
uniref:Uncharacterized protein n=1 Tax=Arundo donax TaxID=35708 RepID=A0A0A8ZN59_ARUDO